MDTLDFIMRYEAGELESEQELIDGFQQLIDSGIVWRLQGSYGRMAALLIEQGTCVDPRKPHIRPELVGTRCECGALYDEVRGGYGCAFR